MRFSGLSSAARHGVYVHAFSCVVGGEAFCKAKKRVLYRNVVNHKFWRNVKNVACQHYYNFVMPLSFCHNRKEGPCDFCERTNLYVHASNQRVAAKVL